MKIPAIRDEDLRWHLRQRQRWRRLRRRALEEAQPGDPLHVRVARAWFVGHNPPAIEIAPIRLARRVARRPRPRVHVSWKWTFEALRANAKLVAQLVRESEQGQRPARIAGVRARRGAFGIQFLATGEEGAPAEGITYQTIANDLRAIADQLDGAARFDRRDLERHD